VLVVREGAVVDCPSGLRLCRATAGDGGAREAREARGGVGVSLDRASRADADCLHRIVAHDAQAAGELFDRHAAELYGFLVHRIGPQEAEDLLHEVFVRALRRASSFRGESSVRTWLYGIARRVVLERYRKSARDPATLSGTVSVPRGPESLALVSEEQRALIAALQQLPDDQAIVLELHHVDGLSHDEISARLGISSAASRKRLQRGSRALRAVLRSAPRAGRHVHLESWRESLLRRVEPRSSAARRPG